MRELARSKLSYRMLVIKDAINLWVQSMVMLSCYGLFHNDLDDEAGR